MAIRGTATILAVGTAVPPNCVYQSDYPDYYFRVTNSEHHAELKEKLKRMCKGSKIIKRYTYLTEELIKDHPEIASPTEPSLSSRNAALAAVVPELGKEAAEKVLQEWGRPRSEITHLIFHTGSGCVELPGPDSRLIGLLGLSPTVNRVMLFHNGCYAGGTALRLAKDIVENNPGSRVLAVCSETTLSMFRGPENSTVDNLVGHALFSDGAAAVIVGSDIPDLSAHERPLFKIASVTQTLIPGTTDAIHGRVTETGITGCLSRNLPGHITSNIGRSISAALTPLGINSDLNSLFWIVHPGGPKILDDIECELKLTKEKLAVSRHVLAEYGNMSSGSVFFVMDEMRRRSVEGRKATTGEGAELGMFIGMGPGLTVETHVLRALPLST